MSRRTAAMNSERLGRPVLLSIACHVVLFSGSLLWSAWHSPISLGNPDGRIEGAVPVTPVAGVPITASKARVNPVANPVQHDVPDDPRKTKPPPPEPPPDDAEVVEVEKQRKRVYPNRWAARKRPEPAPNQLTSTSGARASSPLFTGVPGTGAGVGFGRGSPFGSRFGWYGEALQRRVAEEWRRTLGQAGGSGRKPTVVSFRIARNGRVDQVRIAQSSANRSLDYSCFRAVLNVNPLQPLPPAMGRSSITVEIWFRMK